MNKRQKALLRDFIVVMGVTAIAVVAMVNFKDWVNRSEATRAMEQLSRTVLRYRKDHGSVPPESRIADIKKNLEGYVRLGTLEYRARWIDFESPPDEILAYTKRSYHSFFFGNEVLVLRLDGGVEWMDKQEFETLLAQQQSPIEIQMMNN